MTVPLKDLAPPDGTIAGRQRGAMVECLAPVGPSRLACRLLTAGDVDRQRIERDLHDGVQQRLTALRIRLAAAAEDFCARGDTEASAAFNGFGDEVERAIDEVRAFAHGVYPDLLATYGLGAALASAGRRAANPVAVTTRGLRRCRPEVENAVYFSCLAAIDNAARHAGPARVTVRAWSTAEGLHFTVCDTGCGFDPSRTTAGAGLTNMRDRITALGGTLAFDSSPSHGTRVHGNVPDPWLCAAAQRRPPASGMSRMGDGVASDLGKASPSPPQRASRVKQLFNGARSRASRPERT